MTINLYIFETLRTKNTIRIMAQRSVILLIKDGRYEFFGSPASLFDKYSANDLAISQQGLNNFFSNLPEGEEMVYKNRICEIRKGFVYVKPTTRGRKKGF